MGLDLAKALPAILAETAFLLPDMPPSQHQHKELGKHRLSDRPALIPENITTEFASIQCSDPGVAYCASRHHR